MQILVAGGSGFIGTPLVRRLVKAGHQVILLTRDMEKASRRADPEVTLTAWDGKTAGPWTKHVKTAEAVINLSGQSIVQRWTPAVKNLLIQSRVHATRAIVSAIATSEKKPSVLLNASAVGFYGDVLEGDVPEERQRGRGFLSDLCDLWEKEAKTAEASGVRVALLRIGIVLEKGGGALAKMLPPFQFFAGGPLASGRQWFPWIHQEDVIGIMEFCLNNPSVAGPVNVTAPNPVRMKDFCSILGRVIRRPSWASIPSFVLKLLLGEMSEMLVTGQKAVPKKLLDCGYQFKYPDAANALKAILKI